MSGRQRQPHSCYGNPGLQAAAGSAGKEGSSTPGAGGCQQTEGGDLRRAACGQGLQTGGQEASLTARAGKAPNSKWGISLGFRHLMSVVWTQGMGRETWVWGQRSKVRSQRGESGHRDLKPDSSPLRRAPSSSGFLVTDTTFMTRRFPPWRISATTCLCPTFTTFTPFTWDRQVGGWVGSRCVLLRAQRSAPT